MPALTKSESWGRTPQCYIICCLAKHIQAHRSTAVKQLWWKKRLTLGESWSVRLGRIKIKMTREMFWMFSTLNPISLYWSLCAYHALPSNFRTNPNCLHLCLRLFSLHTLPPQQVNKQMRMPKYKTKLAHSLASSVFLYPSSPIPNYIM